MAESNDTLSSTTNKLTSFSSMRIASSDIVAVDPESQAPGEGSPKAKSKKKVQQPTFEEVLYGYECPCTRREFREYLVQQRADEMIDFFETVEVYTKSYAELLRRRPKVPKDKDRDRTNTLNNSVVDLEAAETTSGIYESTAKSQSEEKSSAGACRVERGMDVYDYAMAIIAQFVMSGSPREINVSDALRTKFLEEFKQYDHANPPPSNLFDTLATEMRSMLRGAFPRFLTYISTQNISEAHVWHRFKYGCIYFVVLLGILLAMVFSGISPYYRLIIITFWQGPYILWASAYFRLCDGLGRLGIRMTKDEWDVFFTIFRRRKRVENKLTNEWARRKILRLSTRLEIATVIMGLITGVCTLFIPPSITSV